MKAVKVQYTVKPEYVEQNKANIRKVMDALRTNPIEGMFYSSYTLEDGQTFMHVNVARDEETLGKLGSVPEFAEFRKALKASQPISPPQPTQLDMVGAGFDI